MVWNNKSSVDWLRSLLMMRLRCVANGRWTRCWWHQFGDTSSTTCERTGVGTADVAEWDWLKAECWYWTFGCQCWGAKNRSSWCCQGMKCLQMLLCSHVFFISRWMIFHHFVRLLTWWHDKSCWSPLRTENVSTGCSFLLVYKLGQVKALKWNACRPWRSF